MHDYFTAYLSYMLVALSFVNILRAAYALPQDTELVKALRDLAKALGAGIVLIYYGYTIFISGGAPLAGFALYIRLGIALLLVANVLYRPICVRR